MKIQQPTANPASHSFDEDGTTGCMDEGKKESLKMIPTSVHKFSLTIGVESIISMIGGLY